MNKSIQFATVLSTLFCLNANGEGAGWKGMMEYNAYGEGDTRCEESNYVSSDYETFLTPMGNGNFCSDDNPSLGGDPIYTKVAFACGMPPDATYGTKGVYLTYYKCVSADCSSCADKPYAVGRSEMSTWLSAEPDTCFDLDLAVDIENEDVPDFVKVTKTHFSYKDASAAEVDAISNVWIQNSCLKDNAVPASTSPAPALFKGKALAVISMAALAFIL